MANLIAGFGGREKQLYSPCSLAHSNVALNVLVLALFMNAFTIPLSAQFITDTDHFRYSLYSSLFSGCAYGFVLGYFQRQVLSAFLPKSGGWIRATMFGAFAGFLIDRVTDHKPDSSLLAWFCTLICQSFILTRFVTDAWRWAIGAGVGCFCADIFIRIFFKDQATPYLPFIDVVVGGLFSAAALSTTRRKLFP